MLSSAPVLSFPTVFDKLDAFDLGAGSCLKGVNEIGHDTLSLIIVTSSVLQN